MEYGSFNSREFGAYGSYRDEKFNGKLSISDYSSDGYSAQSPYGSDLDDYEDDDYSNRTVDLSLGYKITDSNRVKAKIIDIKTRQP